MKNTSSHFHAHPFFALLFIFLNFSKLLGVVGDFGQDKRAACADWQVVNEGLLNGSLSRLAINLAFLGFDCVGVHIQIEVLLVLEVGLKRNIVHFGRNWHRCSAHSEIALTTSFDEAFACYEIGGLLIELAVVSSFLMVE